MSRPKGSKNRTTSVPWTVQLSAEERINFLANAIVDAIIEDEKQGQPLLRKINTMEMQKHIDIIEDRIIGITNDLKVYIDLRKDSRQHGKNKYGDNLGGGNMVMAMGLFSSLGLLSKAYVAVASSERNEFDQYFNERRHARDEQKIFVEFVEFLEANGIELFPPDRKTKRAYKGVWERFRDFTAHLLVPDQGNSVMTCVWEEPQSKSVDAVLETVKRDDTLLAFQYENSSWFANVDKLLALLPEITAQTTKFLSEHNHACTKGCVENLESVLWR